MLDRMTLSQGFKVELNDMNGKMKESAVYAETDSLNPISWVRYFYKTEQCAGEKPRLSNRVWVIDSANAPINKEGIVGQDIELMVDSREQLSKMAAGGISPNLDYSQWGPWPVFLASLIKLPQFSENLFRSIATMKVVHRYGLLDSVVAMDKGSVVWTKNLLYDGETGNVILSKTINAFNDSVYQFNYPAYWAYSGMGPAYRNIDAEFRLVKIANGKMLYSATGAEFPAETVFESGDECIATGLEGVSNCNEISPMVIGYQLGVPIMGFQPFMYKRLWAIDASKAREKNKGLFFIDAEGRLFTGMISSIRILRSGKRNILNASAGEIVSLQSPLRESSPGTLRLVIDSSTRVLSAGATTFRDLWRVDNSQYQKDTTIIKVDTLATQMTPSDLFTRVRWTEDEKNHSEHSFEETRLNLDGLIASNNYRYGTHILGGKNCGNHIISKTIVKFPLSSLPANTKILSADIMFLPKKPGIVMGVLNSCGDRETFNWSTAINYYAGTRETYFSALSVPANEQTAYDGFIVNPTNRIPLTDTSVNQFINCKNLVSDVLTKYKTDGFVFQSSYEKAEYDGTLNYLSFCANTSESSGLTGDECVKGCYCDLLKLNLIYSAPMPHTYQVCRYNINDSLVNPYRWGILGNWRASRAFVYFGARTESDAALTETNIRNEGTIKGFMPFWETTPGLLQPTTDTTRWVWNVASTAYNSRGLETETVDALGRYTATLYGYNQTLPVATIQNSRYREVLYDGFEDYDYKDAGCIPCAKDREFSFTGTGAERRSTEKHTGKTSLFVPSGKNARVTTTVVNVLSDSLEAISMGVDTTYGSSLLVNGKGTGLVGTYESYYKKVGNDCMFSYHSETRTDPTIDFDWGQEAPHPTICMDEDFDPVKYEVTWEGTLQAKYTGVHHFQLDVSGLALFTIWVNGTGYSTNGTGQPLAVSLVAGQLYSVRARYTKMSALPALVSLKWAVENVHDTEVVPMAQLYPGAPGVIDTTGTTTVVRNITCIKPKNVKPRNVLRKKFSPTQGGKMIISAWVKIDGADCDIATIAPGAVAGCFNPGSGGVVNFSLQPRGVRIDGWQRYDTLINVPAWATVFYIDLKAVGGRNLYFDDIRVQPLNSVMKSYAYDPVSLRLLGELDENNYASFYEYDDDGTLVRVKKETERGIMTVKEMRSALLKEGLPAD